MTLTQHRSRALAKRRRRRQVRTLTVATVASVLVVAAGVVVELWWNTPGTNPAAAALAGIQTSKSATLLEQERQMFIMVASASKAVNLAGSPAVAKIQVQPPPTSSSSGSSNAPTLDLPPVSPGTAQADAQQLMVEAPWDFSISSQWSCLDSLWEQESGWSVTAENPSGAYGIPQALPGDKMASAGADWMTNPVTQITWGLGYIQSVYGTPCVAWDHEEADGWY